MSFDPVSYAAGRKAGGGGGGGGLEPLENQAAQSDILSGKAAYDSAGEVVSGAYAPSEPVLVDIQINENGVYEPGAGVDGFDSVEVDVPASAVLDPLDSPAAPEQVLEGYQAYSEFGECIYGTYQPHFGPIQNQASEDEILSGYSAYDGDGATIHGAYSPHFEPLVGQATAADIVVGASAYDDQGNVIQGSLAVPALSNQAGAGDIRAGKSCYNSALPLSVINGTLADLHRPIPCYWDNGKFTVTQDLVARMTNTIMVDGAITGYLVNSETTVPIPCVVHLDANQNMILTGGICVVDGSDTDKYIVYAQVAADGTLSNQKCSLIRLAVTVSRTLADWMSDGDYLSMYLLA